MTDNQTLARIAAPVVALPGSLIFQVLCGSNAYGLAGPRSDVDWRGVYQAPTSTILGLHKPTESVQLPPDQTYWELGHFAKLLLTGNPNVVELIWLDERFVAVTSPVIEELRAIRTRFFTTTMIEQYLGWAKSERLRLAPELVRRNGAQVCATPADWQIERLAGKPGSHLVRMLLGLHGALRTGVLSVTLEGSPRDEILAIKRGETDPARVLARIVELETECRALANTVGWPEPDYPAVEAVLVRARLAAIERAA